MLRSESKIFAGVRQRRDAQPSLTYTHTQTANWNSLPNKSPLYMCEHDSTTYSQDSLAISLSQYSLPGMSHLWLWTCRESQYCFTRRRTYRMRQIDKLISFKVICSRKEMHYINKSNFSYTSFAKKKSKILLLILDLWI